MCHKAPIQTVSQAVGFSNKVKRKKKFKTATIVSQNVRGVKSDEKIEELCMSMKRHDTFVACIQETWRSDDELFKNDDFRFIGLVKTVGNDHKELALFLAAQLKLHG